MKKTNIYLGFGFNPTDSSHHMLVVVPKKNDQDVVIYERYNWDNEAEMQKLNVYDEDKAKAAISKEKWKQLEEPVRLEFNKRLKTKKLPAGRFITGQTPVERMLGKEMLVLIWAIEDCDPSNIPTALRNWFGLSPEERWWLYTMTNAATGNIDDRMGWRKALRYALTENPIEESRNISIFDAMLRREEEAGEQ